MSTYEVKFMQNVLCYAMMLCFILYALQDMSDFNETRYTREPERFKYDPCPVQCYCASSHRGIH